MTKSLSLPARWRFFESYADAIELIDKRLGRQDAEHFLYGIYEYSSWGREPDLDYNNDVIAIAWALVKPNLESSVKRHADGAMGGKKKAENQKRKEEDTDMTPDEKKRLKKLTSAMGKVYKATTTSDLPDYEEEDLLPDYIYEDQAAYMDDDYERRRQALQDEIDVEGWIG